MQQAVKDRHSTNDASATGGDSLLMTKLFLPPVRAKQVGRPRLIEKLNSGLDKALIMVSAPAGYGKTTLVSGWLREIGLPSAWLSLDDDDNEPRRFLQYLVAALRKVVPTVPDDAVEMLQGTSAASLESLLIVLINEISADAKPLVLVLDDLQVIHAQPVLDALEFLLEHIPPELHLVFISRSDLPLPLGRMRALNQVEDIRAQDMRFDRLEVATFLHDVMNLRLTAEDIAMIESRTEGWIAGLQLAALSLRGSRDAHGFVTEFASRQDYIIDYLVEEVLNAQQENVSTFLLQTSGLGRMSGLSVMQLSSRVPE
jgi:LuxR family maltose regulon positive regulatory protein